MQGRRPARDAPDLRMPRRRRRLTLPPNCPRCMRSSRRWWTNSGPCLPSCGQIQRPLADADAARLALLLPAIYAACGGAKWTVADLFAASLLPGERPAVLLRAVIPITPHR